jgi:hypothetical protein
MKRTTVRKQSAAGFAYEAQFNLVKPLVISRSQGLCEVAEHCRRLIDQARKAEDSELAESLAKAARHMMDSHKCLGRGSNVHHRRYRSRGGTNILDNLIHMCGPCHSWVHAHGGFGQDGNVLRLALSSGESEEL